MMVVLSYELYLNVELGRVMLLHCTAGFHHLCHHQSVNWLREKNLYELSTKFYHNFFFVNSYKKIQISQNNVC